MKSKLARFGLVGVLCLPGVLFLTPAWGQGSGKVVSQQVRAHVMARSGL